MQAAKFLVKISPGHRLILVCRNDESCRKTYEAVAAELHHENSSSTLIIPMSCDHARLDSVRSFAEKLRQVLSETYDADKWKSGGIDVLCLNAAVLQAKDSPAVFTNDGLEVTFQTNALSPFLIAYLTQKSMNAGGRVVLSTSGLYAHTKLCMTGMIDEETNSPRKGFEMIDGSTFHFKKSYALSKVCNVALMFSLSRRLECKDVKVNSFSPGLMMSSGLFRHQTAQDMATSLAHNRSVRMNEKSVAWGAGALVYMALSQETGEKNVMYWGDTDSRKGDDAVYGVDFCPYSIAQESMAQECTEDLWRLCCELAGVQYFLN